MRKTSCSVCGLAFCQSILRRSCTSHLVCPAKKFRLVHNARHSHGESPIVGRRYWICQSVVHVRVVHEKDKEDEG